MTEHKGLPVKGYVDQTNEKVDLVNEAKVLEERCLRQAEKVKESGGDPRMVALAMTGLQESFMWLNRAVFQPGRVALPEDQEK